MKSPMFSAFRRNISKNYNYEFVVPKQKIVDYLLSNPGKSAFYFRFGYSIENWTLLQADILSLAQNFPLNFKVETPYGKKYTAQGDVRTPGGRVVALTSIWMTLNETPRDMRFLTAYPS